MSRTLYDKLVDAHKVCDLPDGRRTVASTDDVALCRAMADVEVCGREARIEPAGSIASLEGLS